MTSRSRQLTRSQALKIWREISQGLLNEPGRLRDEEPPSFEYVEAVRFLTQISKKIIQVDENNNAQQRPRELMKALHLDGKLNHDESGLKKTIEIIEDFGLPKKTKKGAQVATVARSQIKVMSQSEGRQRSADEKLDSEILRQIRELRKQGSI